jgi:hypothetical protein
MANAGIGIKVTGQNQKIPSLQGDVGRAVWNILHNLMREATKMGNGRH